MIFFPIYGKSYVIWLVVSILINATRFSFPISHLFHHMGCWTHILCIENWWNKGLSEVPGLYAGGIVVNFRGYCPPGEIWLITNKTHWVLLTKKIKLLLLIHMAHNEQNTLETLVLLTMNKTFIATHTDRYSQRIKHIRSCSHWEWHTTNRTLISCSYSLLPPPTATLLYLLLSILTTSERAWVLQLLWSA